MGTSLRLALRDLQARRWQSAGLAAMVAVVTLLVAGGFRARGMLEQSRDAWCARLSLAHLEVRFQPAPPGCAALARQHPEVLDAEERLLAEGWLSIPSGAALPALVHVLPPEGAPRLSAWHLLQGRWPAPGEAAAVVERSAAHSRGIAPGQRITVTFEEHSRELPVVGVALSPEHLLLPVHPEYALPLRDTVAVVGVSAAATEGIPRADRVDSLLLTLRAGADPQAVGADLLRRLPITPWEVLPAREQPTYVFTEMILNAFTIYMPLVAGALAIVALTLLGLALAHLVWTRRGETGVLLAMGHSATRAGLGLVTTALWPVLAGAALGALLHGVLARSIFQGYARSVGYAPLVDPGAGLEVPLTALGCLLVAVVACALPAAWMVRRRPARLLRPAGWVRRPRDGPAARALAWLRGVLRVPLAPAMAWAGVLRRGPETALSVLALGLCFAVVTAFLCVHVTHLDEVADSVRRLGLDATVHFRAPAAQADALEQASALGVVPEALISRRAVLLIGHQDRWHRMMGVPRGRFTEQLRLARGRVFAADDAPEVLVDHWIADEHGVDLGDELLFFPHANAPEGTRLEVVGILEGVSLGLCVLPVRTSQGLFDLEDHVTGLQISSSLDEGELDRRLRQLPDVESVYPRATAIRQVRANFDGSEYVLVLGLWMAIGVAVVFLGVLALMDCHVRSGDLAILRALGWQDRHLLALVGTEVLTRGALALGCGMLLARPLAHGLLERLAAANHYHMQLQDPLWLRLTILGAALVVIPLGALPAFRQARRMPPARVLRHLVGQ